MGSHLRCSPVTDTRPSAALRAQARPRSSSADSVAAEAAQAGVLAEGLVPGLAKAARPEAPQGHPSKSPPFRKKRERMGHPRDPGHPSAKQKCIDASLGVLRRAKDSLSQHNKGGSYWAGEDACPYVALIGGRDARQTAGRMPALRKIRIFRKKREGMGHPNCGTPRFETGETWATRRAFNVR
jgi:hypothetical protein